MVPYSHAEFFSSISLAVKGVDGRETFYNVDSAALGSMFVMLPLNQFYAIGSMPATRSSMSWEHS